MTRRYWTAPILLLTLALGAGLLSCQGRSESYYRGDVTTTVNPDGTIVRVQHARSEATATTPAGASTRSSTSAGIDSAEGVVAGTWQPAPIDWAQKNSQVFYYAAIGFALLGAGLLSFGFGQTIPGMRVFAFSCLGAAGAFAALPTALKAAEPVFKWGIPVAAIAALAFGGVWLWAKLHGTAVTKAKATVTAKTLAAAGDAKGAVAVQKFANPKLQKAAATLATAQAESVMVH